MGSVGWALVQFIPRRKEDPVRIQGGDSHLQAKESDKKKPTLTNSLILDF